MSQTNAIAEDTPRGQLSKEAFNDWFWSLDETQLKVFFTACAGAVPGDKLDAPFTERKNHLTGWVQCSDDMGWDPNWLWIAARHEFLFVVLDDNFARPFSEAAQANFAAMADGADHPLVSQQALEHDKAAWEALKVSWAKLRAQEFSSAWLREASIPSSRPVFNMEAATSSQLWHGYSAGASISAEDPAVALFKWVDALDDEQKANVYQQFYGNLYFPADMQKQGAYAVTSHVADWLAGRDIEVSGSAENAVLQKVASFNRVIMLHHYLEQALLSAFKPEAFDSFEEKYGGFLNEGKTLEEVVPDMFEHMPPDFDQDEFKDMLAKMLKQEHAKLPDKRVLGKIYLDTWEKLKASTLNNRAMRAWYCR